MPSTSHLAPSASLPWLFYVIWAALCAFSLYPKPVLGHQILRLKRTAMNLAQEHSKEDSLAFNRYFLGVSSSFSILSAISFNIDWAKVFQLHSKFLNMLITDKNEEVILLFYINFKFKLNMKDHQIADLETRKFQWKCLLQEEFFWRYAFFQNTKFFTKVSCCRNPLLYLSSQIF